MDPTQDLSLTVPNTPNFINPAYATPEQRKMLYQYANALMQPQPIKSGWQGLASIANALVGGYMGHQADLAEQGGTAADQQRQQIINQVSGANGALAPSGATSAPATAPTPYAGPPSIPTSSGVVPSPSPGQGPGVGIPGATPDDTTSRSVGTEPNIDILKANLTAMQNKPDYMRAAAEHAVLAAAMAPGASPAVAASPPPPPQRPPGLGYVPPSVPPPIAAMGAALQGPSPMPAPAGAPPPPPGITPQQLAFAMTSPNMSPAQKMQLQELAQPKTYQDVNGNVAPSYFNRPTGAPIANLGRQDEVAVGSDGSVHIPVQTTGPVGAGTTRLFGQPLAPGGGVAGAGGGALAPVIGLGNEARANANTQNQIATQKAAWAQQNLEAQKQETALRYSAAPLYQLKGILDQNGGQLPTGVGADKVMNFGSAANFVTSLLGHPLDSADTPDKISSLQLFNKYGTMMQQALASGILPGNATNASLESAGHTSPGIGLSNTVNVHLIDNLTRMNDLRIKYAQDYQQHYKDHGGDMSDWNNAWVKSISGDNSVPLSKYPTKESKHPDGAAWGYYPSTDPSGFSWKPKSSVQ